VYPKKRTEESNPSTAFSFSIQADQVGFFSVVSTAYRKITALATGWGRVAQCLPSRLCGALSHGL